MGVIVWGVLNDLSSMEKSMAKARPEEIDYEKYVIKKSVEEYWRAEEKVQLVVTGMSC